MNSINQFKTKILFTVFLFSLTVNAQAPIEVVSVTPANTTMLTNSSETLTVWLNIPAPIDGPLVGIDVYYDTEISGPELVFVLPGEISSEFTIQSGSIPTTENVMCYYDSSEAVSIITIQENQDVDNDEDGYTINQGDCDDTNPAINPAAIEVCDGIDNDCDGEIDEGFDQDNDGYSSCQGDCDDTDASLNPSDLDGDGITTCDGDCDDDDPNVFPGNTEICENGIDDDCNGLIDEVDSLFYPDSDGDGYGDFGDSVQSCTAPAGYVADNTDCNDNDSTIYPGAVEICDGKDNNCNTLVDEGLDLDGDGYTTCDGDCDDNNAAVHPGALELCDGIDNDCDGTIDMEFPDLGESCTTGIGECNREGVAICSDDGLSVICSVQPGNSSIEICDGVDNDCDGEIDEGFDQDQDGYTTCQGDCDDADASAFPGAPELCDGKDNDCDTVIPTYENDIDGDSFSTCDGDCNDYDASINPVATEIPDNGIDEDCDGTDDTILSVSDSELNNQFKIRVYPNPVSEYLNIIPSKTNININTKVYDILGKIILITNKETIDFRYFNSGIYILKIYSDDNKIYLAKRLIIKK